MPKVIDMKGQKFGRLTVLGRMGVMLGEAYWNCKCDCGTELAVSGRRMRSGNTLSCGCLRSELRKTGTNRGSDPSKPKEKKSRRTYAPITMDGRTQSLAEWAKELGISHQVLRYRIDHGWSEQKIMATKADYGNRSAK